MVQPSEEAVPIANELNQIFVDTVRASGGNNAQRVLICNTYCAGANTEVTSGFVLPTDTVSDRLIVETHIYQPFYFTSESYPDVTTWDSATLDLYINNIYTQFVQNGIPVIIGEFGCADKGNMEQIISWAKYYVETCTAYGIPCIYWDNGTQYKLYSRTTGTVTEPDLLGTMVAASKGETYEIDTTLYGDVDGDGSITQNDVNVLQKWLLRVSDAQLAEPEAADLYADDLINGFDLCLLRQLLLEEENLCSDVDNWSSWVNTSNGAAAEVTYTDDGVIVDVTSGGIYSWDVQASYRNISLEEGATYQISYDYTATVAQAMDGNVLQNYGDYSVYYNMSLSYTTEKQHYESTFTMDATDKDVQIAFNCGGSGIVPCTIEISNLRLVKVD